MNLKVVIGAIAGGATAGLLAAVLVASPWSDSAAAADVEVRIGDQLVDRTQADDAVRQVSEEVGFAVKVPESVPANLKLTGVEASPPPPADVPHVYRTAATDWVSPGGPGRLAMRIEQAGRPYDRPVGRAAPFDLGLKGADAWVQRTEVAVGYWVFTERDGFLVVFSGDDREVPEADVRMLLASLAE